MSKAIVFFTTGFEEIEALTCVDILSRGNIEVVKVSLEDDLIVEGGHQVEVKTDILFDSISTDDIDLLVLPGGTVRIDEHAGLKKLILDFYNNNGKIAAICAAPMVLGGLGLLKDKKATCYPGFEKYLNGAKIVDEDVVVDGNIITGKGPALSIKFALKLLEEISNRKNRDEIAAQILLPKQNLI